MKFLAKALGAIIALTVVAVAFMAYFMRSVDIENQVVYDGLGRILSEPPIWAQIFITSEHVWAGLGWHLIDIVWFFGGLFVAYKLYEWSEIE